MEYTKEEIMNDPATFLLTVNGLDVVINKEKRYAGTVDPDVSREQFVKVVMYLKEEGFFDIEQ